MRKAAILIGVIVVAAAVAVVLRTRYAPPRPPVAPAPADNGQAAQDRPAPPFALPDISGNVVSSDQFAGKALAINFFATWCPPCREEIPGFVEVFDRYRDRGFELVGISLDTDTRSHLAAFISANGIRYRILFGDLTTARAYGGVSSIPTTFFVGRDGRIRKIHVGYLDRKDFEREVRKLL